MVEGSSRILDGEEGTDIGASAALVWLNESAHWLSVAQLCGPRLEFLEGGEERDGS